MIKKILKCESNPYVTMYHNVAFPLSIIQGNANQDITPWICGRYINCMYDENSRNNQFNICIDDEWGNTDGALSVQSMSVDRDVIERLSIKYVDILKSLINQNCYPNGGYNEEYIPGKWAYKNQYYKHDFLLTGYDDEKEVFHSIGYLNNNVYSEYEISYANMEDSLKSIKDDRLNFLFFKFNDSFDFSYLNIKKIHNELVEYVNCYTTHIKNCHNQYFGFDAIKRLKVHINEKAKNKSIDFRFTKGFLEHKKMMKIRFDYLCKTGFISSKLVEASEVVFRKSEMIHLLAIKYMITQADILIGRICDCLDVVIELESEYLPQLLESLKNYLPEVDNE